MPAEYKMAEWVEQNTLRIWAGVFRGWTPSTWLILSAPTLRSCIRNCSKIDLFLAPGEIHQRRRHRQGGRRNAAVHPVRTCAGARRQKYGACSRNYRDRSTPAASTFPCCRRGIQAFLVAFQDMPVCKRESFPGEKIPFSGQAAARRRGARHCRGRRYPLRKARQAGSFPRSSSPGSSTRRCRLRSTSTSGSSRCSRISTPASRRAGFDDSKTGFQVFCYRIVRGA